MSHSTLASALVAISLSVQSAEPHKTLLEWLRETRAARLKTDYPAWLDAGQHSLALAPDHPDLLISVARARAAMQRPKEALDALRQAVNRGAGLDVAQVKEFKNLPASPDLEAVVEQARKNLAPVPRAKLFAILPDPKAMSEGIAYDPASRRLFVGTNHGEILQVNENGAVTLFVSRDSGLMGVLGLKVDPERHVLWAANGVFPELIGVDTPKPDLGVAAVSAFDLKDGKLAANYRLDKRPTLHAFNDLALASNGDVYVTDSAQAAVYRVHSGKLELLVRDEHLTFANGVVITPDQKRLYVAHVEGLSLIDISTKKVQRLEVPTNAAVNSIDGLAYDGADLLGIQSSPFLARVVRISLGDDGRSVKRVTTVNARSPAEYGWTTAAVGGNQLYVVGGAPTVDSAGNPLAKEPRPQIVKIPLR